MPLLIVLGVAVGLSTHTVVNCGDEDEPDICSAVIGFSPFRGSLIAFAYEGRARVDDFRLARGGHPEIPRQDFGARLVQDEHVI